MGKKNKEEWSLCSKHMQIQQNQLDSIAIDVELFLFLSVCVCVCVNNNYKWGRWASMVGAGGGGRVEMT